MLYVCRFVPPLKEVVLLCLRMDRRTYLTIASTLCLPTTGCLGDRATPEAELAATTARDTSTPPTPPTREGESPTTTGQRASSQSTGDVTPIHQEYTTTEVRVISPDGDQLGEVTAAIADTRDLRYLGLSDTESLPADRGMLFVYESVEDLTYVMREMDFGIDIIFADSEGEITTIHHARPPGPNEDGEELKYSGRGQYVLEVNRDWTTDRGIDQNDILRFTLP